MIYLVYSSRATHPFNSIELAGLLRKSCENNARNRITGLLLYKHGQFMQLLEGREEDVRRCYDKICRDSRHTEIIKLVEKPIHLRYFAQWSMAFQNLEAGEEGDLGDCFSQFLSQPFNSQDLGTNIHEGIFLLLSFKKNLTQSHED